MKLAPLISHPIEIWSQLAAVVCKDIEREWLDEEDPTLVDRPQEKGG